MRNLLRLIICFLALYVFVTIIVPLVNKLPFLQGIQETVQKYDINTAAFFYSDDISTNKEITKHTDL